MDGQAASTWSHGDYIQLVAAITTFFITVAVVVATYRGPLIAARQSDERREAAEKRSRQMEVFRNLMGFRYDIVSQQFVLGLNMILVEFSHSEPILAAFRTFLGALEPLPNAPPQSV